MRRALFTGISLLGAALLQVGCGGSSDGVPKRYEVTLQNLTYAQPFAPMAAVLHGNGYSLFSVGDEASVALERLAEGGNNSAVITEAEGRSEVASVQSGEGVILPGGSERVMLEGDATLLSLAAMLVNTNDAFAGLEGVELGTLERGDTMKLLLRAYDAGTEADSESAATVPGPAAGGEGFNAARNDTGFVHLSSGVVTADEGLAGSALSSVHRWDNPVASLNVRRVQ